MTQPYLNYDKISNDYDQRYPSTQHWERGDALLELAHQIDAKTILEVGSGTGYWLNLLHPVTPHLYGMDFSTGMIAQAQTQHAPLKLTRGTAPQLPYKSQSFNLLYCVDAIHHFGDHAAFISEAFRVLKPGGALAIIGHDPHSRDFNWYVYDYFDTVLETDLLRYPSGKSVLKRMEQAGFKNISSQSVEHIQNIHVGDAVLRDPFIKHNATSQLALLSNETYQAGLKKIGEALAVSKERNENIVFHSEIRVKMFLGYK
jgi:ubiquinone/menaquinone biosynthesis C-methylase UbiE